MTNPRNCVLAILAGGRSSRFGSDKAALPMRGGVTLLQQLVGLGRGAGLPVVVAGRSRPEDWAGDEAEFILDAQPELGPLGGLVTVLAAHGDRSTEVLLIGCDMPRLDTWAIDWLVERGREHPHASVVAATLGEELQPLFAIYRSAVLANAREHLARGERALHQVIAASRATRIAAPGWLEAKLVDVDTPSDWQRVQAMR